MSDSVKVDVNDPANTALGNAFTSSPFIAMVLGIVAMVIPVVIKVVPDSSVWAPILGAAGAAIAYIIQRGSQKNAAIKGAASIAANAALGAAVSRLPGGATGAARFVTSNP